MQIINRNANLISNSNVNANASFSNMSWAELHNNGNWEMLSMLTTSILIGNNVPTHLTCDRVFLCFCFCFVTWCRR